MTVSQGHACSTVLTRVGRTEILTFAKTAVAHRTVSRFVFAILASISARTSTSLAARTRSAKDTSAHVLARVHGTVGNINFRQSNGCCSLTTGTLTAQGAVARIRQAIGEEVVLGGGNRREREGVLSTSSVDARVGETGRSNSHHATIISIVGVFASALPSVMLAVREDAGYSMSGIRDRGAEASVLARIGPARINIVLASLSVKSRSTLTPVVIGNINAGPSVKAQRGISGTASTSFRESRVAATISGKVGNVGRVSRRALTFSVPATVKACWNIFARTGATSAATGQSTARGHVLFLAEVAPPRV